MRILFDQAQHDMRNKGSNALLEAAIRRIGDFWPDASLHVITLAPNLLKLYYPHITAVNPYDLRPIRNRFEVYQGLVPRSVWWSIFELREEFWHRHDRRTAFHTDASATISANISLEEKNHQYFRSIQDDPTKRKLQDALSKFDLFVASGGGYMCDTDKPMLWDLFDRLEAAIANGIPTVMVGQGIGPLKDPQLLERARETLPAVQFILCRNRRGGLPLLNSLGVLPERRLVTGDDAIEMAYEARTETLGRGIRLKSACGPLHAYRVRGH